MQEFTITYQVVDNDITVTKSYTFLATTYELALEQLQRKIATDYIKPVVYQVL